MTKSNNHATATSSNIIENFLLAIIFAVGLLGSCYFFKGNTSPKVHQLEIEHVFEADGDHMEYSYNGGL